MAVPHRAARDSAPDPLSGRIANPEAARRFSRIVASQADWRSDVVERIVALIARGGYRVRERSLAETLAPRLDLALLDNLGRAIRPPAGAR